MTPRDDLHELDDATAAAAEALAAGAIRFQPSPRFEDRLAGRLRAAAAGIAAPGPVAAPAGITPLGRIAAGTGLVMPDGSVPVAGLVPRARLLARAGLTVIAGPASAAGVATPASLVPGAAPSAGPTAWPVGIGQAVERVPRPVLVGGAIASGVSLAGAAVVAWVRLRRSS